ncbi:MAG TPA: S41 family peptidase [Pyrinomonadaceae bacterium]|jgi:carboxyl-terminal processing protease|nr:S41 family peptidase [Pyrinomonadaceae bacterium]
MKFKGLASVVFVLALSALACALALVPASRAERFAHESGPRSLEVEGGRAGPYATREGRLRIFDEVWEQVRERYFDPTFGGVDWQGARGDLRPFAADARDAEELYAVLRRMLGRLRDPHTRVFAPGDGTDWRVQRYVSVGVSVRELGGALVVADVERDSQASRDGVRAGDELLTINGETAASLFARKLSEAAAGDTRAARLQAVARLFDGPAGSGVALDFRRAGETRARAAKLIRESRTRIPTFDAKREGGARLVRFNIFTPEVAAQFARSLRTELKNARALVIDLRDNGGGEADSMADVASALLPAGLSLGRFTDREGQVKLEPFTRAALLSSAETLERFRGPVVILTNARTASAAEVFAAAMRERRRALVVGEQTCGCVLGIRRRHVLPDGGVLDVSEMDYRTAAGSRLEGAGVAPDMQVAPTLEDLRRGRDRALTLALELLKAQERRG